MMNLLSVEDIGAGTGSRYLIKVFGTVNTGIGFRTRKAADAWIDANHPIAIVVSPDTMRDALNHWYSQFQR